MEKATILIVDDEPFNINILCEELNKNYSIIVAKNGEQALKRVSKNPIDLILLDIMMPGMDGYEVCQQLKSNPETKHIPIIFITSKNEDEDEARGLYLGAVDYITKPFYLPIVKSRVKTHLELKIKTELLEKLASLDGLTNVYNRREFDSMLEKEWNRAHRSHEYLSLIIADVDHFKSYNDRYGHVAGDECLRQIASILRNSLRRSSDFIARYGGEEFAIILPHMDSSRAKETANYLRKQIETLNIPNENSPGLPSVTISIGVSTIQPNKSNHSPLDFIKTTDEMLYKAKDNGRNQVCICDLTT